MPKPIPPRQARSRATADKVLSAAEELFSQRGELGFTLPEVAREAGVSVAIIYRRFGSREELLMAVFDRVRGIEEEEALSLWKAVDWTSMLPREMVARLVRDIAQLLRSRERLMRAIMARRLMVGDDQVFEHGLEDVRRGAEQFARAVRASGHPVTAPDANAGVVFAYRMIVSVAHRWAAREIEVMAPEPMGWDEMFERLTDVVTRYLFGP